MHNLDTICYNFPLAAEKMRETVENDSDRFNLAWRSYGQHDLFMDHDGTLFRAVKQFRHRRTL